MDQPTKIWPKSCYYCGEEVTQVEHDQVEDLLKFWINLGGVDDFSGFEDICVHMVGVTAEQMDYDGNPVVCARDAIREMHEAMVNSEYWQRGL